MKRRIVGWIIIAIFGLNLIYSLFFTMGESFVSHIPAIVLSVVMLYAGYRLVRKKRVEVNNKGGNGQ